MYPREVHEERRDWSPTLERSAYVQPVPPFRAFVSAEDLVNRTGDEMLDL